jgi:hypothetical protein
VFFPTPHLLTRAYVCSCHPITQSDIRVGQELTFDYRFKQEDEADRVPCHCGAPSCKGFLN